MKYLSIVVPSYNSEKYLNKCIDSLLIGKDDVEIIIVNDGSKDNTLKIALEYQEKYPNMVRVVDKENGGHGSGVNKGIELATGLYFKCVDSDDWVDEEAYLKVLNTIKEHAKENKSPDLYFTNFVFERIEENTRKPSDIKKRFPLNKFFTWKDVERFKKEEYLMMHMFIYRLDILRKSEVKLLEHTFYVDNIFIYQPLPLVKTMYFIDVDFYRYYVGRADQSVTLENMTKNYQHQLRVMRHNSLLYSYDYIYSLEKHHRKHIIHDLVCKSFLTLFYITAGNTKQKNIAYDAYFKEFKEKNRKLYNKIKFRTLFIVPFLLPRSLRNKAVNYYYKKIIKRTGWN